MRNGAGKLEPSRGWLRVRWKPEDGVVLVSGDSEGLLGVSARRLIGSSEPLGLFPAELASALASGPPEIPVNLSTRTLAGTVSTVDGYAEILLFGVAGPRESSDLMLDELGAGVVVLDGSGVVSLWNRTMAIMFRVPLKHALGRNIQDILASPLIYSWENVVKMALEGKQVKVVCRPDPQRRIECAFTSGARGVVGTCFDTTESFQAETRLRTSRKMNQAYFHSVSTGLVLFDKDFRILVANRAFGKIFGLVENLLGMHMNEIIPGECYEMLEDQTRPLFSEAVEAKEDSRRVRFMLPDRTRKVVLQSVRPISEDSGEVFYAVGIFEDISDITMLRRKHGGHVEAVRKINALAAFLQSESSIAPEDIAEKYRDCISAEAAAIYLSDHLAEERLAGFTSSWPQTVPEIYSDLRLSPLLTDADSVCRLTGDEMGLLAPEFGSSLIFPLESERKLYGRLVAVFREVELSRDFIELAEAAARMIRTHFRMNEYETDIGHLDLLVRRQGELTSGLVDLLDVPVAMFRTDWSVVIWNRPMEEITGVPWNLASSRPEMAASILFRDIGGVNSVQRLVRNGSTDFPESWEVEDQEGVKVRCTWRMIRCEAVEGNGLEPVVLIAGTRSGDVFSINAARKAAETYSALSRGTSALLSASDRTRISEAAAASLLDISGASRVTVDIRGISPVSRTSYDMKPEEDTGTWTLPLETETDRVGECRFQGGREYPVLKDFARNVARTCIELEKTAIGRRFAFLAERAAGKFFISNLRGRILLSTWMDFTGGAVSNRTVYDMFPDTEWSDIEAFISGVLNSGRLNMEFGTDDGGKITMAAAALDGHAGESLIIWWPLTDPAYGRRLERIDDARVSVSAIVAMMDNLMDAIAGSFRRVRDALNPDHPVASVLNTAGYAFEGMQRGYEYLRLIRVSLDVLPQRLDMESLVDSMLTEFTEAGMPAPDVTISGDLPDVAGNEELIRQLLFRVCMVTCTGSSPVLDVSVAGAKVPSPAEPHQLGGGHYVRISVARVDGAAPRGVPDRPGDFGEGPEFSGGISPEAEVHLITLILRLSGGDLTRDSKRDSLEALLPCID